MTSSPFSTKERILDAAEQLFARHGFAGASLRQVTSRAGVNLAAVNYHFGSKEKLHEEVFRRRLDILNQRRREALDALRADATLEDVLTAFIHPALALSRETDGGDAFVRIMARAYAEHDARLREFLSANYGDVLKRFAAELAARLPALDKPELYWRLDIVTGALTYAMANFGITRRREDINEEQHRIDAERHLVQFAAAGLRST